MAMLPIHEALPALKAALRERSCAVLVAPPGAGKTTGAPPALLGEPWAVAGRLILLEPRRLAARAAAARMAETLGEAVGGAVGLRIRGETRVSAATRIEVVTEGVFTRMILDDPGLEGVAGVLFDEFHERSVDADLGLAFARDAQTVLRPDLRLLVMSATLDGARIGALLGDAPVVRSEGRAHPIETLYLGRDRDAPIEAAMTRAIGRALRERSGSVLAFLPGAAEIRRAETRLRETADLPPGLVIAPLFGAMEFSEQLRATAPPPPGVRKLVLATSIAETSLTIEGVRVVVDSGLSRVPRYDPGSGLTRLVTVRVSRAAADQRRGRAGRTEPGVCYRLWDEAETRGLIPFDRPEILESDLTGVALDLAAWGAPDGVGLALLDPPPVGALRGARATIARLGAVDTEGALTSLGYRLSALPLPPRLGAMLLRAAGSGQGALGAEIAAILTERGLGGADSDLAARLDAFRRDRGHRAEQARRQAARWATLAEAAAVPPGPSPGAGELLAIAYPERVARARETPGEFLMVGGRGVRLDLTDPLARAPWLAIGDLASGKDRDRILLAAPLSETAVRGLFADAIATDRVVEVDERGRVQGRAVQRLGALTMTSLDVAVTEDERRGALRAHLERQGLAALPTFVRTEPLRARVALLRTLALDSWPDLSEEALSADLDAWLGPALGTAAGLDDLSADAVEAALWSLIGLERRRELDRLGPERFTTPAGTSHAIDYTAEGGPRVEVRVQELFGLASHPRIADGRIPLTLSLLSPAHRPVQLTRDLPSFWAGSWSEVRSDMRGRYPKHPWPEDPLSAVPTTRAKPRGA